MKKEDLKHGMPVTCVIEGVFIEDAVIKVHRWGHVYLCQDMTPGGLYNKEFGKKYAWRISDAGIESDYYKIRPKYPKYPKEVLVLPIPDVIIDGLLSALDVYANEIAPYRIGLGLPLRDPSHPEYIENMRTIVRDKLIGKLPNI